MKVIKTTVILFLLCSVSMQGMAFDVILAIPRVVSGGSQNKTYSGIAMENMATNSKGMLGVLYELFFLPLGLLSVSENEEIIIDEQTLIRLGYQESEINEFNNDIFKISQLVVGLEGQGKSDQEILNCLQKLPLGVVAREQLRVN